MIKQMILAPLLLFFFFINTIQANNNLVLLTEENPPFNFMDKGVVKGISVSLLEEMLIKSRMPFSQKQISLDTWSSVFSQTITTPNALLFSASRTAEREHLFNWVGPIAHLTLAIFAKKSKKVKIKNANDLKKYKIVTIKNASAERAFIQNGGSLEKVSRVSRYTQAYKMLEFNRADGIVVADLPFMYWIAQQKKSFNDYEIILTFQEVDYYIAANKQIPLETVENLQDALDEMKNKHGKAISKYDKILGRYLK